MPVDTKRLKDLFATASELSPDDRPAYLERECGADSELRERVEALLRAYNASGSYLCEAATMPRAGQFAGADEPVAGLLSMSSCYPKLEAGAIISGRYTLIEKIGEGGMGEVWVAKQSEPVKR